MKIQIKQLEYRVSELSRENQSLQSMYMDSKKQADSLKNQINIMEIEGQKNVDRFRNEVEKSKRGGLMVFLFIYY